MPRPELQGAAAWARVRTLFPGVCACFVAAAAATFLSEHYGAPVMLFALLLGMAMNFLSESPPPAAAEQAHAAPPGRCQAGIEYSARQLLRFGVALLGLRITAGQVAALGRQPVAIVVVSVVLTIAASMLAARLLGFQTLFGLLSGGAVAICGASAALALAAALPQHPQKERATLFTVVSVSALSTVAMIVYPMIAQSLALDPRSAGVFLGATIHDVAQVVGAGCSLSRETGGAATLVKLMRVAMLLPVIVAAVLLARRHDGASAGAGPRPPLLPGFAVAFAVLVAINSTGWLPAALTRSGSELSRWYLVAAFAGIGMKTQLKELVGVGLEPVLLMAGETNFLLLLALLLLRVPA
ncbi:MAG: putative sulfate exporter family transporter [Rubrivivax sp.]|nr:putative sulfate exporter family transporter [Rubrivivax sp.]